MNGSDVSTKEMIIVLSDNMKSMFNELNKKVYTMASDIEDSLTKKFSQLIEKRLSKEMTKVKQDINSRIYIVKDDTYRDIKTFENHVKGL